MAIQRVPGSGRGVARGLAVAIGIPPELAEPAGERAVAAMMALKQAREAGGGMLRGRHLHRAQQHIAALDPARHGILAQHLQAHVLALQGRGGDTEIAHVTPGEVVVPKRLQHPEFLRELEILAHAHGIDPATLRVGSGRNAINPRTGQMEFNEQDDIPLNMNGLLTGGYDGPDITLGDPSDYSTLNSLAAQTGSPNFDQLTPDFHSFDPGAYDPGNFNVNDLSNYVSSNGAAPQSGSYGTGQGLLSLPQTNPSGPLAYPPMSQGTGQSQYVDGDGNPIEGVTVTAPREHGLQALPRNPANTGYYNYGRIDAQYGLPSTLQGIGAAASAWNAAGLKPFGVGNMSLSDGSAYPPHTGKGHLDGTSVDVRPVRTDGKQVGLDYTSPAYDRAATQKLVDTLRATGGVSSILFNDPNINGVSPWKGHDDHLHVTFDPSWQRP